MKRMKVEDAVGKPLAHDVIQYGPGTKKVLYRRGHVISSENLEDLKDSGNYRVYVNEGKGETGVHEEEAAMRMARAAAGENIAIKDPSKGRVRLAAEAPGLLKVNTDAITEVDLLKDFVIATKRKDTGVKTDEEVASVKIFPLAIEEARLKKVEKILEENKPVIKVIPPQIEKIAVLITGNEIYSGRIDDAFESALKKKLKPYNLTINRTEILPDDKEKIMEMILECKDEGFELILTTGGMAIDAGDMTPEAIEETGAKILPRGTPVFPGNMTMVAYLDGVPILGLPACVIPDQRTSFDFLLPRVLANEELTKRDIAELGHGGLL